MQEKHANDKLFVPAEHTDLCVGTFWGMLKVAISEPFAHAEAAAAAAELSPSLQAFTEQFANLENFRRLLKQDMEQRAQQAACLQRRCQLAAAVPGASGGTLIMMLG